MLAPLNWLKDYVTIKLPPKELGDKLTEIGLGCEKIIKEETDTIFELEITPNRPDLLSIIGVAREIAAIENTKIKYPEFKTNLKPENDTQILPLIIHPNFTVTPRLTGIIINNVQVKDSPQWLKDRLTSIGQRPINNIVDVTNFVMFELGNPIHSFDYHKIKGAAMWVRQAKGGEKFETVDDLTYHLPKGAIIYEDTEKIFDLVGIKGGKNSGTYPDTKAVFIVVEVDDPSLIRKASLAMGLRSVASSIFERNVNRGGTIDALKRVVDLILETAGGEVASDLYDLKNQDFKPWKLTLRLERLNKILGIEIPKAKVITILESLNLSPKLQTDTVVCTIPTYRNDLQIEEDLIEEVARLYGYNNFPKTLPTGQIPTEQIPYFKDYRVDERVKHILTASGFSEVYTYSLVSESDLKDAGANPDHALRVDNPVSREFEYLRPTLKSNLKKALRENKPYAKEINLFELGKVYLGKNIKEAKEEYMLSGITNKKSFAQVKGMLESLLESLGINQDPTPAIEILDPDSIGVDEGIFFEMNYSRVLENINLEKVFKPLPKFPPVIEDLALVAPESVKTGDIISEIKKQSEIINDVSLLDQYGNTRTFHVIYQDKEKNLTNEDVAKIREKILKALETKFSAKLKE
ncbi:MAG TPA: phenylalanine--tRNA ligase subunit beta [Candidatus Saccharimonadales bacterium]|nr:phenylalanine--tRNA ligase subunit beta [Candidatus Saccharimonadales bacterium]